MVRIINLDKTKIEKLYLEEKMTKIYNLTDWPYILLSDTQYVEVQDDLYQIVTVAN